MDLSTLDTTAVSETGAKMEVTHPVSGALLAGTSIVLAGQDSDRYRAMDRKISNKRLAQSGNGQRLKLTAESLEADNLNKLVACTISWEGIAFGGSPKECTPENVREAYTRLPWLREQAETFIGDRANFLKA
jgi:hypothetical protein